MARKVLVFAGAGASKAVEPDQFPTTVEFFSRLPDEIKKNRLFRLVEEYLLRRNAKRQIDIEEILWELQELANFCEAYRMQDSLVGYGLHSDRFIHQIFSANQGQHFGAFDTVFTQLAMKCKELVEQINAVVFELYSYEPTESDLAGNWLHLLNKLNDIGASFDVFTTNYDLAIESAVAIRGKPKFDDFTGATGNVSKRLDLERWKTPTGHPLLTKLHGSINWKFGRNGIQVGDLVYTGDHGKQAIIYPGFKGSSTSEFFQPLHDFLGGCLEQADVAIFIGFAFRDSYINEMIAERMKPNCSVYVINPAKIKFPLKRMKPMHLDMGFDRESVDYCFATMQKRVETRLM